MVTVVYGVFGMRYVFLVLYIVSVAIVVWNVVCAATGVCSL